MEMRHGKALWKLVACIVGILALAVLFEPALAAYHKARMASHYEAMMVAEQGGDVDANRAINQYEYHRSQLVRLGHLIQREYDFPDYLDEDQDETHRKVHREVWKAVRNAFPEHRHVALGWSDNTLRVWCHPDEVAKWDEFVDGLRDRIRTGGMVSGEVDGHGH